MSFDVAAEAYDAYMGHWSAQLAPGLIDLAGVTPGHRAIDVGCGPGALTSRLVERLGPAAVAAVDPSAAFVEAARRRHPGVDVRQASAEALPFGDAAFDVAAAQLVVHFMRDPVAGIGEMARVTRPGGVVAASVWDYGGDRGPLGPFWSVARELDPAVDDESNLAGTREGHLGSLFRAAGLRDIEEAELPADRSFPDFDAWWDPFTRGVGPGGAYLGRLASGDREALRAGCRDRLPDGRFTLTAVAWAVRGVAR